MDVQVIDTIGRISKKNHDNKKNDVVRPMQLIIAFGKKLTLFMLEPNTSSPSR
jgi:hypothetical protein